MESKGIPANKKRLLGDLTCNTIAALGDLEALNAFVKVNAYHLSGTFEKMSSGRA
jgi:hypothetical protein